MVEDSVLDESSSHTAAALAQVLGRATADAHPPPVSAAIACRDGAAGRGLYAVRGVRQGC
jgi:hypothetical protein